MYTKPMHLSQRLAEALGKPAGEPDLFGIEVELEGRNIVAGNDTIFRDWTQHQDGSLRARNGGESIEYVLAKPLNLQRTETAVKNLFAYLNKPPAEVFESYRTSIHVHINCLEETQLTICNFITISAILDELLVSLNGQHRIGNNFCLRSKDAEGLLTGVINSIEGYGQIYQLPREERYSSMNLGSLLKFGTIEYRSLECTTDVERLNHWVNTLQAMKVAARGFENPKDVIGMFSRRGPEDFLIHVLGDYARKYLRVQGADIMLQRGMRLAQDFAYCSTWLSFKPGEEPKKKGLGKYYNAGAGDNYARIMADEIDRLRNAGHGEAVVQRFAERYREQHGIVEEARDRAPGWGAPPPIGDPVRRDLQQLVDRQHERGQRRNIPMGFRDRYHIQDGRVVRKPGVPEVVGVPIPNPFLNPLR